MHLRWKRVLEMRCGELSLQSTNPKPMQFHPSPAKPCPKYPSPQQYSVGTSLAISD